MGSRGNANLLSRIGGAEQAGMLDASRSSFVISEACRHGVS
jgi:hypothetical protein